MAVFILTISDIDIFSTGCFRFSLNFLIYALGLYINLGHVCIYSRLNGYVIKTM